MARRNLDAKAPNALPALKAMAGRIKIGGMSSGNLLLPDTENLPEKAQPVLAAAIRHRCDILVTGDRTHFGQFYGKKILGVYILSPALLAEAVLG